MGESVKPPVARRAGRRTRHLSRQQDDDGGRDEPARERRVRSARGYGPRLRGERSSGRRPGVAVAPPSPERLTPLVNNIRAMTEMWSPAVITDVLVRVPGPNGEFAGSQYRVVPRGGRTDIAPTCDQKGCQPTAFTCGPSENEPCTLEAQLLELSKMEQAPFRSDDPLFDYADPARRIAEWASENTGDIVILANVKEGFYFDKGVLASNHGSLTYADAVTPLAFAYPGATSDDLALDNVLNGVRAFLKASSPEEEPARAPIERRAMEAALGLLPCDLKETGKCEEPTQPPEP